MTTTKVILLGLGGVILAAPSVFGWVPATSDRPDRPGKIVCPLTGELICRDQCPAIDAARADCPGRIECPLTGELVCKDECPLNSTDVSIGAEVPSCCQGK